MIPLYLHVTEDESSDVPKTATSETATSETAGQGSFLNLLPPQLEVFEKQNSKSM